MGFTSASGPKITIIPASLPLYLSKSFLSSMLTRMHFPVTTPFVPGVQALAYTISGTMSGEVMRALTYWFAQPRPNGPQDSR